ncbi:MAG: cytochrome c3 family protein [Rhodospirillales bacterium]
MQVGSRPRTSPFVLVIAAAVLAIGGPALSAAPQQVNAPGFVGSTACAGCHEAETKAWHGSYHDLAMAEATEASVLGDFNNATFTHAGITSRFFRRDGKFFVNTEGADGKLADFEIRYTFGVTPLQQYLIAFPDGRMQALGLAWDSRPKEKGGQRWFHLYPDPTPKPGDPLHWTGIDQTWNFQCSECHSTELRKNYDAASNTYATTWAEIHVGCEACHGPGAAHVEWAKGDRQGPDGLGVHFDEREGVHWLPDPATATAHRSLPRTSAKELEMCGVCHARASKFAEPWRPGEQLLQTHIPSLLSPGLFEADGKMLDEVYNYAPFRQSKMFMAGVSCSDCHDPHSLKLVAEGDAVCGQCHDGDRFATAAHHHHDPASDAARCVSCHMPKRTYMVVDPRHDHGFRIPRPDQSMRFGTTNACNDCHTDKDAAWAAAAIERWYGPTRKGLQTWTETFAAARDGKPEAAAMLLGLAENEDMPAIARATALDSLAAYPGPQTAAVAQHRLADADPLVRRAALGALQPFPVEQIWPLASPLLADPVRGVRIEAAALLASMPTERLAAGDKARLARGIDEYIAAQQMNADRPEHRVNLGSLYAQQGQFGRAEAEFAAAKKLDPTFAPAYVGLSQTYAQQGRNADGERILREALARLPDDASLHHALGLNLVRQRRPADALAEIGRAATLDPATARYTYVYAIALNAADRRDEAIAALEANHARHPGDRDTLYALVTINRDAGRTTAAVTWAEKLAAVDPSARPLVDQLRQSPPPR